MGLAINLVDYYGDEEVVDVWVHFKEKNLVRVFKNVNTSIHWHDHDWFILETSPMSDAWHPTTVYLRSKDIAFFEIKVKRSEGVEDNKLYTASQHEDWYKKYVSMFEKNQKNEKV